MRKNPTNNKTTRPRTGGNSVACRLKCVESVDPCSFSLLCLSTSYNVTLMLIIIISPSVTRDTSRFPQCNKGLCDLIILLYMSILGFLLAEGQTSLNQVKKQIEPVV